MRRNVTKSSPPKQDEKLAIPPICHIPSYARLCNGSDPSGSPPAAVHGTTRSIDRLLRSDFPSALTIAGLPPPPARCEVPGRVLSPSSYLLYICAHYTHRMEKSQASRGSTLRIISAIFIVIPPGLCYTLVVGANHGADAGKAPLDAFDITMENVRKCV